jgi:hypothetical protein
MGWIGEKWPSVLSRSADDRFLFYFLFILHVAISSALILR